MIGWLTSCARPVAISAALLGCGASQGDAHRDAVRAYVRETTGDDMRHGGLRISTNSVTTDGRIAKMRGLVTNNYEEPVVGVRYVVTIYDDAGDPLDVWRHEVDTTIAPGDRKMMRLDVESMYWGRTGGTRFEIVPNPVKVGERDVSPPPDWE